MNNNYMSAFQYIGSRITSLKIKNDFVDLFDSNEVKKSIDVSHEILSIEKVNEGKSLLGIINLNIRYIWWKKNEIFFNINLC